MLVFTVNHAVIQYQSVESTDLTFVRSVLQIINIGILCLIKKNSLFPRPIEDKVTIRCWMIVQGLFGGIMAITGYAALGLMPLGQTWVYYFSIRYFFKLGLSLIMNSEII